MNTVRNNACAISRPERGLGRIGAAVLCLLIAAGVATAAPALIVWSHDRDQPVAEETNKPGSVTVAQPTMDVVERPTTPTQDITQLATAKAMLVREDVRQQDGTRIGYGANQAIDADLTTAWAMPGDGTDRALLLSFDKPVIVETVGLVNGYAKIDPRTGADRYEQNRRVAKVSWFADDALIREQFLTDGERSMQNISLNRPIKATTLALVIDRTWGPGNKLQDDTAISEVSVTGWTTP